MKIEYLGHSCFRLTRSDGYQVVIDPFDHGSLPGLELRQPLEADAVYCSHEHHDHHAIHLVSLKNSESDPTILDYSFMVPHDEDEGRKRGMNLVQIFQIDDIRVAHLGDIGREFTPEELGYLDNIDVLMIPVGGHYTIDKYQTKKMIEAVNPKLTILMHYRTDAFGYDEIEHIDTIKEVFKDLVQLDTNTIETPLPSGVITLSV